MSAESILPLALAEVGFSAGGTRILDGITVRFEAGPVSVILGSNGAGKSVLLRLCHGLLAPTAGRIAWHGGFAGDPRRRQAMVFQRPVMLRRSALANVVYGLALAGHARADRSAHARRMLERVGLLALAERPARLLSGGEQQRLALARAWALKPEVLFLDEPTANLDPSAARMVEEIVGAIAREGTKVIMTTHDLGQAKRLADEILFLHRGRLIERASKDAFFAGPSAPEAAAFLRGDLSWD
ncbi:MAG: ATP-binding cassette domain-containing protein [Alphaproteobacteria bacterium]|nr:ATP-binding cassette domain-containing protein [Alphaproteobacteria bacterium]